MAKETKTVSEVLALLEQQVKEGNGDLPFYVSIPFRNEIGLHYEGIVNVTSHEGIVDMHTSMPEHDDVKSQYKY